VIYQGNLSDESYQPFLDMVANRIGMSPGAVSSTALNIPVGTWTTFVPDADTDPSTYQGVSFYITDPRTGMIERVEGPLKAGVRYQARRDNYDYTGAPMTPDMVNAEPGATFRVTFGNAGDVEFDQLDPRLLIKSIKVDGKTYTGKEIEALGYIPAGAEVTLTRRKDPEPEQPIDQGLSGWVLGAAGKINDMTPEERVAYSQTREGQQAWTALQNAGFSFAADGSVTAPDGSKPSLATDGQAASPVKPASPAQPQQPPQASLPPKDSIILWLGTEYPPGSLDFGRDGKYEILVPESALGSSEKDWPSYVDIYEITYDKDGNRKRRAVKDNEVLKPDGEYVVEVTKTDLDKFKTGADSVKRRTGG
jgi:hypothetical protein